MHDSVYVYYAFHELFFHEQNTINNFNLCIPQVSCLTRTYKH